MQRIGRAFSKTLVAASLGFAAGASVPIPFLVGSLVVLCGIRWLSRRRWTQPRMRRFAHIATLPHSRAA
jgi:hypothetical protein